MNLQYEIQEMLKAAEIKDPLVFARDLPMNRQLAVKQVHDGFSSTELASLLGMGLSTLSDIKSGRRRISYKYLDRVKQYLYCEMYHEKEFVGPVDQDW
jgi:transcriptional regulator with XRE-family HTH domain